MHVISARNVCDAWHQGVQYLHACGKIEESRAGRVLVAPGPVTTVYRRPWERVLFCPSRDCNPIFHLMESAWMLAGRSDAKWLDLFVRDFSERFAEPSGFMHGAYGKRWRGSFLHPGTAGELNSRDQLATIADMLRRDPTTRRAVLTMWSPERDLNRSLRDHPCNTHCYFRARPIYTGKTVDGRVESAYDTLDMMVTCRSNDIVWGAYGANAVHMSVMHEYVAALARMQQGTMTQVSWNYHAYEKVWERILARGVGPCDRYDMPLTHHQCALPASMFHPATVRTVREELDMWLERPMIYSSPHNQQLFDCLLVPLYQVARMWRNGDLDAAIQRASHLSIPADWRLATTEWLERRRATHDRVLEPTADESSGPDAGAAGRDATEDGEPSAEGAAAEQAEHSRLLAAYQANDEGAD